MAWLRCGRKYVAPTKQDRIIWVSPEDIEHKPVIKPPTNIIPQRLVLGGNWDQNLKRVDEDIVFKSFKARFVEGKSWDETGYMKFLTTDISEHGNISTEKAKNRCKKLDVLFKYIENNGYKPQAELEQTQSLIEGLSGQWLPPAYREVSVSISRNGELLWQTGMHRLAMAKLLHIDQIPVRVNARHEHWQEIRDSIYKNGSRRDIHHPDIEYLA